MAGYIRQIPADEPIPGTPVWHQWKEAKAKGRPLPSFVRWDQFPKWEPANGKSISGTCWHFEKWAEEKTHEPRAVIVLALETGEKRVAYLNRDSFLLAAFVGEERLLTPRTPVEIAYNTEGAKRVQIDDEVLYDRPDADFVL